ncbi:MAG: lysine--tRNA ligase [Candidatus Berkelbacteria bacterium]|nr:lysine--tRNA ligase [Candidatus Berkelbacteria bacterium]
MFWVDEIVEDIIKRISPPAGGDSYLITDWKTPSGHIHVGALRGVIVHDIIRRGLAERDKKAVFQYGFDDFDPMDGLPVYINESFKKYMGMPLCNIPAPDNKSKSFAEQYLNEFEKVFNKLGIYPKIVKNSVLYKQGKYNEAIKVVLDNAALIRKIYKDISGSDKGEDWLPFQVVCPSCGKIGTTKVTGWDGKKVNFSCEENLVTWAKGCGYKGKISPFDGNGKIPWKVEWAVKFYITKTDVEGEGKDHFAAGGSRDIADKIYREIFPTSGRKEPPYDIRYEWFMVEGTKMSTSRGVGVTAKDMIDFLPANILRFLFIRTRFKRAIDFQPEGEAIPNLYDEYDRVAKEYQKDPKSDLGRAFHYTEFDTKNPSASGQLEYLLRFSKIAYMLQMPRADIFTYAKEEKNSDLTDAERKEIKDRIEIAKKWLEVYAPENYKFTIQEKLPKSTKNLSPIQKELLANILETVEKEKLSGEELHQKIHQIKKEMKIDPREAFSAIYQVFLGKDSGPQVGWLLASLDKEFVVQRIKKAINSRKIS